MRFGLLIFPLFVWLYLPIPMARAEEIGVILAGTHTVFWQAMMNGALQAGRDRKDIEVVVRSPADGAAVGPQPNIQLRMIEYMVERGVAGIVLAPEPLKEIDVPVTVPVPLILVDRESSDFSALSVVKTDNFAAGRKAAQSLDAVLSPGSSVAILRLSPDIASTTARENGFLAAARDANWEIVLDTYVGFRSRESLEKIFEILQGVAGRLDAIFIPNETTALGALRAVSAMPEGKLPRLVVFDWRKEYEDAINRGFIHAAVVQDPYRMGYLAVEKAVGAARGKLPDSNITVGVTVVTKDNLAAPETLRILRDYLR